MKKIKKVVMPKNIVILSGSPQKNGNTAALIEWFSEGARTNAAHTEVIRAADMKFKVPGCLSCRACQKLKTYECVINDDGKQALQRIQQADVIVMATPLYFYGPSAQLKVVFDRFFSLYKWDNAAGTMETPLKGKTLVLLLSGFEDVGLEIVEKPFRITAEYTGMIFDSLLVPNAGVSGEIRSRSGIREQAVALGSRVSG